MANPGAAKHFNKAAKILKQLKNALKVFSIQKSAEFTTNAYFLSSIRIYSSTEIVLNFLIFQSNMVYLGRIPCIFQFSEFFAEMFPFLVWQQNR